MVIEASAPVRICDIGGWTDTWFGGPGRVLNIAVSPGVGVSIREEPGRGPVVLRVATFGDQYVITPGGTRVARHPLLEAAVDALPPPSGLAVEITVDSEVPAGCGTGTSAAVVVAMLGALQSLCSDRRSRRETAYEAHRLEVEVLGNESGVQDQLSAAFGGINYMEVDSYPEATIRALPTWEELNDLFTLVYLGRAHNSSDLHRQVIESGVRGSDAFSRFAKLRRMRSMPCWFAISTHSAER